MRRLGGGHLVRRALSAFKTARILRLAEWMDVSVSDPNLVQYVTDAMAYGEQIQINYEGSGWRTISPYGWNTSKQGNILLMCYKDTGEVRSYRLDRILDVQVDSASQTGQGVQQGEATEMPEATLPGEEQMVSPAPQESPFQDEINILMQDEQPQEQVPEQAPINEGTEPQTQEPEGESQQEAV